MQVSNPIRGSPKRAQACLFLPRTSGLIQRLAILKTRYLGLASLAKAHRYDPANTFSAKYAVLRMYFHVAASKPGIGVWGKVCSASLIRLGRSNGS